MDSVEFNDNENEPARYANELVRLTRVHKLYGGGTSGVHALFDVHLNMAPGEMVAICGPSGSGKTSLLNIVGMLDAPTEGSVVLANLLVSKLSEHARAELRADLMGFVFQSFFLIPVMTALENVLLPAVLRARLEPAQLAHVRQRAGELLAQLGMAAHASHYPPRLDASQCQRVAIARAFITQPRLVLADEPVSRQDRGCSRMIMDLFARQQQDHGTAFLITTRDQRQFSRATRCLQLSEGRLAGGTTAASRRPVQVQR